MKRTIVLLASVGLLLLFSFPAHGDTRVVHDGNDSPSEFDLAKASHGHIGSAGKRRLTHSLTTYEPWNSIKGAVFVIRIDTDSDAKGERFVIIKQEDSKLVAKMIDQRGEVEGFRSYLPVWRPDNRTVKVKFKKRMLKRRGLHFYDWSAESDVETNKPNDPCSGEGGGCTDLLPNRHKTIRHRV